jgi:ABC-type Fe3+-hydroxamate transport system substrate-binding protein/adenosylcobinamide amidohydrolase
MMKSRSFLQSYARKKYIFVLLLAVLLLVGGCDYPLTFKDDAGVRITLLRKPVRVVSLVPSVTEIISSLGAGSVLVGVTHYSRPTAGGGCEIVGGFLRPSLARIRSLHPDLVFISALQENLRPQLEHPGCKVVEIKTATLADSYSDIELIGRIVGRQHKARELNAETQRTLRFIRKKIEKIPTSERRRVVRMMGHGPIVIPGGGSFQNEIIQAAGGIVPECNEEGASVTVDVPQFIAFNPQFIYACGDHRKVREFFGQPEFSRVSAVQNHSIHFFPCSLTCRAATHVGEFVEWLAASIYPDYFSRPDNMILPEGVNRHNEFSMELEWVTKADVVEMTVADFRHRTLVVDLAEPMQVLSTLEGFRQGITCVGNHYLPPPTWNLVHRIGVENFDSRIEQIIDRRPETTALLFTGADMRNLVRKTASFKEMKVVALVTAGVCSNAVRMSADEGKYYEFFSSEKSAKPGTINIILLTNTRLTPRAMSRALISACEGKSAALQDLDIRSSVRPAVRQATGTGTDNIIVVEGRGRKVTNAGGHSKMGELIARAVYDGVIAAIGRQNRIYPGRSIFYRLRERRIEIYDFVENCQVGFSPDEQDKKRQVAELSSKVEELLLETRYASFVAGSLALSDAYLRGQVDDLRGFRQRCNEIADEISGSPLKEHSSIYNGLEIPIPLRWALEALVRGVGAKITAVDFRPPNS